MVFTENSSTMGETQTEVTQQGTPPQDSFLQKLVETKGENWRDPEVLARGKLEADGYIKTLEDQLALMREDISKQDYSKQILDQLQNKATDSSPVLSEGSNKNSGDTQANNTSQAMSEENLKSLVEQTLSQRDKETTVKRNLSLVDDELTKTFGTEATVEVKKKADALGMSMDRLKEIAAESPNAFFTLIGEPKKSFSPMVTGSVRTDGVNMQNSSEHNFDYYQKLRRENRALYYSPKVQQQMMADASRLGDRY